MSKKSKEPGLPNVASGVEVTNPGDGGQFRSVSPDPLRSALSPALDEVVECGLLPPENVLADFPPVEPLAFLPMDDDGQVIAEVAVSTDPADFHATHELVHADGVVELLQYMAARLFHVDGREMRNEDMEAGAVVRRLLPR